MTGNANHEDLSSLGELERSLLALVDERAAALADKVIAWRRDLHAHPELGNREVRTAGLVADHLRALDLEVKTAVAHTGVVGVLRGGLPGPVVALRADMDALPVVEEVDVAFQQHREDRVERDAMRRDAR